MKSSAFVSSKAHCTVKDSVTLPLCVDLDGTLIKTDLLWESFLVLLKRNPLSLFLVLFWFLKGRAYLKDAIARRVTINPGRLPYQQPLIELLNKERRSGRPLILATAATACLANKVAAHLGVFREVIASDHHNNLDGKRKLAALIDRFGEKGFSYAVNAPADLDIWAHARDAIVVNARAGVLKQVRRIFPLCHHIEGTRLSVSLFLKAIRLHQWTKNVLVFVPLLTSHQVTSLPLVMRAWLAFLAFGLVASSAYVLNDLMDLDSDRHDSKKRDRPFASGDLSPGLGLALIQSCLPRVLPPPFRFGPLSCIGSCSISA